jgi:ubiquitin carboxyl-terminal hydrolase 22/27/51
VESKNGFIYCHDCKDFVYDPTLEELRSGNAKKRKHSALSSDEKRLVSANSTATPCSATGLRGLYNMGQTCFMAVILQSLIHNPFIRTFYLAEGHRKEDCEREACTSCALDDIFTDFFGQEKHEGYGAVHMLQACWKGSTSMAGYSQQDAHEFLQFILNSLHNAILDDDERKGARKCQCIVHHTFGGLLKSTVTCSGCKNTSTALDPFMDLSLDIRSAPTTKKKKLTLINGTSTTKEIAPMDLTECLDRFTSTETLSAEAGSYNCRHCPSPQETKKKFSLSRLPPVVPIHLKRFSHSKSSSQSSKVETKIRFPTSLDLTPYTTSSSSKSKTAAYVDPKSPSAAEDQQLPNGTNSEEDTTPPKPIYELSSVIVHKGKIDNGHYISYSRQGEHEWFRFDDSMVVQVEEKEVLAAEAYMLFYVVGEFGV